MRKKAPVILAILVLAAIAYYMYGAKNYSQDYGLSGTGTIEATEINLGSPIPGIIGQINFSEGDAVKTADVVAVIKHEDLKATRSAFASGMQAADSQIEQARIKLANTRRNVNRLSELAGAGSVSRMRYDDADSAVREATAGWQAARFQRETLTHQMQALDEKISYATVTSPVDGVVIARNFEAGEMSPAGGALLTVARLKTVWLKIYVTEKDLGRVRLGQKAAVSIDSYPGREFEGRVTWISPQAEFTPKTIQTEEERVKLVYAVKITVDNSEGIFKIGMPADARLVAEGSNG
jgi:membrane fusion protein YbhG